MIDTILSIIESLLFKGPSIIESIIESPFFKVPFFIVVGVLGLIYSLSILASLIGILETIFSAIKKVINRWQINTRFKKAVKMATDAINEVQREMGFVVIGQMFSTNGKNFDALTEENKALLEYLISKNPMMTEAQREACKELYRQRRVLEAVAKKAKEAKKK